MKTQSTDRPISQYEIEFIKNGEKALIRFFLNVIEMEHEIDLTDSLKKEKYYEYDMYLLIVNNTNNLVKDLNNKEKFKIYLEAAILKDKSTNKKTLEVLKKNIIEYSVEIEKLRISGFDDPELHQKLKNKIKEHEALSFTIASKK